MIFTCSSACLLISDSLVSVQDKVEESYRALSANLEEIEKKQKRIVWESDENAARKYTSMQSE